MDLLTNAIESIQAGIEDYQAGTRPRLLSAVRNIHSGILLLYKEALRRESPAGSNDVLMMARIVPARDAANNVVFIGEGTKTVDTEQIRARFEALGIKTDWRRVKRIGDVRNEVEHRHPRVDQAILRGLISDSFLIVRDFIREELDEDPLALLGEETWNTMLEVSEVYLKEKQECDRLLQAVEWHSPALEEGLIELACEACGSGLLRPNKNSLGEVKLQCTSCGQEEEPESYVPRAIKSALSAEAYIAAKDGGETPYVNCPDCGAEAYVIDEGRCALCEHEAERDCARCGCVIPAEELDSSPFCGYCYHMMNKDD